MNRFPASFLLIVALCVTALSLGYIVFNSSTSPLAVVPIDGSSQTAQVSGPVISGVSVSDIQTDRVTVRWNTDVPSDTEVFFGTNSINSHSTLKDTGSSMVTSHGQIVAGLRRNTSYQFYVQSRDASGKLTKSPTYSFKTGPNGSSDTGSSGDTTAPSISGVSVSGIATDRATISWNTNEAADTYVEYGLTSSYGSNSGLTDTGSAMGTSHSQTITGLEQNTVYNYRVTSKDAAGNVARSSNATFTTARVVVAPTASLSANTTSIVAGQSATLIWTSTDAVSCSASGSGFSGTKATAGSETVSPTSNTTYSIVCSGPGGTSTASSVTISVSSVPAQSGPTISNVSVTDIQLDRVTINWTTDIPSDSEVFFGIGSFNLHSALKDTGSSMTTSHVQILAGLRWNSDYQFYVQSRDASGKLSKSSTGTFKTSTDVPAGDTSAPSVPTGLSATVVSSSQVNLSWNASSDNVGVIGYQVFRDGIQIANITPAVTTFQNTSGIVPGATHSYNVTAYDTAGNVSPASTGVSVKIPVPVVYSLTVTKSGTGTGSVVSSGSSYINCGSVCSSSSIPAGTTVTLTATPSSSSSFVGWSGACNGSSSTCTVTVGSSLSVGAIFATTLPQVTDGTSVNVSVGTPFSFNLVSGDTYKLVGTVSAPDGGRNSFYVDIDSNPSTDGKVWDIQYPVSNTAKDVTWRGNNTTCYEYSCAGIVPKTWTLSAGVHTLYVNARENGTSISSIKFVKYTPPVIDGTDPSIPSGLTASVISSSQINLSWNASSDNVGVTGYQVYRNGAFLTTVNGRSYVNTGLSANTTYSYSVAAFDAAGNVSNLSSAVSATTQSNPSYTVTVTKNGTGAGTVTSGGSINCGNSCTSSGDPGMTVTLTATPAAGSVFAGWSGVSGCSTAATCSFTLNANTTINAVFNAAPVSSYSLTVTTSGSGTVTRSPNLSTYAAGTSVTLTASPASGYTFSGWGGACSGSSSTCTLTINSNTSVSAAFTPVVVTGAFTIGQTVRPIYSTVNVRQVAGGTLLGTQSDTSVGTVIAGPVSAVLSVDGVTYTWWNIDFSSGADGWVGEDGLEAYTASASTKFQTGAQVQVSGTGTFLNIRSAPSASASTVGTQNDGAIGSIVSSTQNGTFADGYYWWNVNFASGADGWAAEDYLRDYVDPSITYTLSVTTSGSGTVTRSPNLSTYAAGTSVTLTASPASGYTFSGWGGACSGAASCTVTMNGNVSVSALFSEIQTGSNVYYVTPTGAGSKNGSSWANAYADLPSTLVSGATYMLQPGSYNALNVTSSGSANAPIVIRRSLELAPNEPVASSDRVSFGAASKVTGNNIVIDGKGWQGITFRTGGAISTSAGSVAVMLSGSNVTLRNAFFNGTFGGGYAHLGFNPPSGGTIRVEYSDFYRSTYEDQFAIDPKQTGGDIILDHNVFRDNVKSGESNPPHRDIVNSWTGKGGYGLTVSNSIMFNSSGLSVQGDGFLLQDAYGGSAAALKYVRFYNNVAYNTARPIAFGTKNSGWSQEFKVYNNTFVKTTGISVVSPAGSPTTKNGLSSTSNVNNGSPSTIEAMYGADGKPFTSDDAFALKSATSGGSTISTTDLDGPQYDITGKLRTGSPDLGAYEY